VLASLAAFARLSRLKFLAGGVAGGALGTLVAAYDGHGIRWAAYAVAQLTISAFHLMTHYANDYFDREADALALRTPYSGGSGVLVEGALPAAVALRAAFVCAGIGLAGAAVLAANVRQPVAGALALGIALLAWSYSAPPVRLLARGLGECDTALVVAVLVPLCAFAAQRGAPTALALATTLPGACAMVAMMLAVEYPDLAADAAAGKRNLAVRLGGDGAKPVALGAALAVYLAIAATVVAGAPLAYPLLETLTLPAAAGYALALRRRTTADSAGDEDIAARGVTFFFLVVFAGVLAYATGPRAFAAWSGAETVPRAGVLEGGVTAVPTLEARIEAALDEVRPGIHRDGGDVWLVRVDERIAYVQMIGACGGCAMATATLRDAIEATVVARCSEIERVEQV
jgi:1,4-dihydroxy-2-naphthoate octaprenyltransferase